MRCIPRVLLSFCVPWLLCCTLEFFSGNVQGIYTLYSLTPAIFFFLIGLGVTHFARANPKLSFFRIAFAVILLCFIDQTIKIIMINNKDIDLCLIKDWLSIRLAHYKTGTGNWLASRFGIAIPFILFIPVFYYCFRIVLYIQPDKRRFLPESVALVWAGYIASAMDKIIYGGSYNYILLRPLVHCDLNEIYLIIGGFTYFYIFADKNFWAEVIKKDKSGLSVKNYLRYEYNFWHTIICNFKNMRKAGD